MMQLVRCAQCNKTGLFELQLKFNYWRVACEHCHDSKEYDWLYHFCNISCMFTWLEQNEIASKGFPCRDCHGTGFAYGFESNGTCKICEGNKRIKERLSLFAQSGHKDVTPATFHQSTFGGVSSNIGCGCGDGRAYGEPEH